MRLSFVWLGSDSIAIVAVWYGLPLARRDLEMWWQWVVELVFCVAWDTSTSTSTTCFFMMLPCLLLVVSPVCIPSSCTDVVTGSLSFCLYCRLNPELSRQKRCSTNKYRAESRTSPRQVSKSPNPSPGSRY